jgi:hypothetical protein
MSAHEVCVTVEVALNGHVRNNDDKKLERQQREFLGEKTALLQSFRDAATGVRDASDSLDTRMASMEKKLDNNLGVLASIAEDKDLLKDLVEAHGAAAGAAASEKTIDKLVGKALARQAAQAKKEADAAATGETVEPVRTTDPKTDSK